VLGEHDSQVRGISDIIKQCCSSGKISKKKGNSFLYLLPSIGFRADPVYRQSALR